MTGRILVVDTAAANRIVLKVKLAQACYEISQACSSSEAIEALAMLEPDLVILGDLSNDVTADAFCSALRADEKTADIPLLMITPRSDSAARIAALRAGADDVITKPIDDMALRARVRALMRAHEARRELTARQIDGTEFEFDGTTNDDHPASIAIVTAQHSLAAQWMAGLDSSGVGRAKRIDAADVLTGGRGLAPTAQDVYVIDADLRQRNDGLRLLSDLKARPHSRHAATIVVLPDGDHERAATALDLGAGDILFHPVDRDELAQRTRTQLRRKRETDRLRHALEAGLRLAMTDPLTGLSNRRAAMVQLPRMLKADVAGLSVMMIDLDHFKSVNDRFGHPAGDAVLASVASSLAHRLPENGFLARVGGEEFLAAIPAHSPQVAETFAEGFLDIVRATGIPVAGQNRPLRVSASIGIAMAGEDETATAAIARADAALYAAKRAGRDRVHMARLAARKGLDVAAPRSVARAMS